MRLRDQKKWAMLFLLPALLVYSALWVLPTFSTLGLSLTEWDGITDTTYVGLRNFNSLFSDHDLWGSLWNNTRYFIITTCVGTTLGLAVALLLEYGNVIKKNMFRTFLFLPVMLSWVVVGFLWRWIYNPVFGLLNNMLKQVGLSALTQNWLGDPNVVFYAIVAVAIWKGFGFSMVVFSAGLQNIPDDLLEAAKIDGAKGWQMILKIVIPLLKPVISVMIILGLIDSFRVMDVFVVMTSNVQSRVTQVIATYIYKMGFDYFKMGYAAALSVVLFLIVMTLAVIYLRTIGKDFTE
jgi:ABC-type sugar transport system permease subunit